MKTKLISLSAISAALSAMLLILGAYVELVDLFAVIIASIFPLLPLYYKSYKASVLSYLVGGIIALVCSGFNYLSIVFPAYFGFLGLYPIVKHKLLEKNTKKVISIIIGLIWCVLFFYALYCFYVYVSKGVFDGLPDFLLKYILYFVGIVAIVFFIIYDKFVIKIRIFLDKYLSRIIK